MTDLTSISNDIRFLAADMVQRANSGHPGTAMGLSDVMTVLSKHINLHPKTKNYLNRDRIVFSGGHASALVYSMLHLWGYKVSMDDLKDFRQLGAKTAGHPELHLIEGIDISTGPLGQGIANAVGFSLSSKYAEKLLGKDIINHNVFCLCGDGDLQEGISYEASSLAGKYQLDNLILIYDSNNITIDGTVDLTFVEDVRGRFESQKWEVFEIDGHNYEEIDSAIEAAKKSKKPAIIISHTKIAKGSLSLEGDKKSHGAPLGKEDISKSKIANSCEDKEFCLKESTYKYFQEIQKDWDAKFDKWNKSLTKEIKDKIEEVKTLDPRKIKYPTFKDKIATRSSNHEILNAIAKDNLGFVGGSADLASSNKTDIKDSKLFPDGQIIRFGVREHSMAAISNAIANYGLFTPFCATFLVFSDYLLPAVRMSAIMNNNMFYIFTHDSIHVGEDGTTHQPVEQLAHFRSMPNVTLYRPADANENVFCFENAIDEGGVNIFALTRQDLPILENTSLEGVKHGAYIIKDEKEADICVIASGSEVSLALEVAEELKDELKIRVISMPSYNILLEQDASYIKSLFGNSKAVVALEASSALELYLFADIVINISEFGESGKAKDVLEKFGFTRDKISKYLREVFASIS